MAKQYDAIVVGAGFGGTACAGLLARHGLKTTSADVTCPPYVTVGQA